MYGAEALQAIVPDDQDPSFRAAQKAEQRRQEEYEDAMYQEAMQQQRDHKQRHQAEERWMEQQLHERDQQNRAEMMRSMGGASQRSFESSAHTQSSAGDTEPVWASAAAGMRDSLPLPSEPLSPGSDLLSGHFTFDSPDKRRGEACEQVVHKYEHRGGSPLRLRPTKQALLEHAQDRNKSAKSSLLLSGAFQGQPVDSGISTQAAARSVFAKHPGECQFSLMFNIYLPVVGFCGTHFNT